MLRWHLIIYNPQTILIPTLVCMLLSNEQCVPFSFSNLQCTMGDKVPLNGTWDAVRAVFLAETYRARATRPTSNDTNPFRSKHIQRLTSDGHTRPHRPRGHTTHQLLYMHAPSHTTTHDSEVVRPRRQPAEQPPPGARSRARGGSGQLTLS